MKKHVIPRTAPGLKLYWMLAVAVFLAAISWVLQCRSTEGVASMVQKDNKHHPAAAEGVEMIHPAKLIAKLEESDRRRLEGEGGRLVNEARNALAAGDMIHFRRILDEIIFRYKGDPNPLVLEFAGMLRSDDPELLILAAGLFILTDAKTDEAVQVLRGLVRTDDALLYGSERVDLLKEEFPGSDYRFRAADMLALYRMEEARDDIWSLYQKTGSDELIRPLRRLNDPRIVEVLKQEALKRPNSIENMKLIGEFGVREALPMLRRQYEDESLNSDLHFRTLYPLWRITGEEKYFEEFAAAFKSSRIPVPYLAVGGQRERDYLVEMLGTEGSDTLCKAAMALHLRHKFDEPLVGMLAEYFHDVRGSNWKDGVLARRLVGSIDDPDLTRVAEEYERKYKTGFHDRYAVCRKNWRYPEWEEALFMD